MDFYATLEARRSVRKYSSDPVEQDKLDRILNAARIAPSAANRQPWHFFVIQNAEKREALKAAYAQDWFTSAPVIICACAKTSEAWQRSDGANYAFIDVAIAFEHLVLAATAEGLGTCWIGAFKPEEVKRVLDLADDLHPVAMTPMGYPSESPAPRPRKQIDQIVTIM